MKLIVKIGLIALLLIFNYQGVDADIVLPLLTDMLLLQNIKIIWHLIMVHWIPCFHPLFTHRATAGISETNAR